MNQSRAVLLMLANAVMVFLLVWSRESFDELFFAAAANAAALLMLALLLAVWPRRIVVVLARGVAVAVIVCLVGGVLLAGLLSLLMSGDGIDLGLGVLQELIVVAVVVAVQVLLLRALPLERLTRIQAASLTALGGFVAFLMFLALYVGSSMAKPIIELVQWYPRFKADSVMTTSIAQVQRCAVVFAQRQGEYPASLAALGPAPQGNGCLTADYAKGQLGRVTLKYEAGAADSAGRIRAFRVLAGGRIGFERGEPRMAYGDESGIVRSGDSTATPGALPIIHGGMHAVRSLRACAEIYRSRDSTHAYPRDHRGLDTLFRSGDAEQQRWLGCNPSAHPGFFADSFQKTVGTYTPMGNRSEPQDYIVDIRPRVYGLYTVRSIRVTARGAVHATTEDRAATEQDAVVPVCAYEFGDGSCAPEPGGQPARVSVELPDSVRAGTSFTVRIVDDRPAAERTHPYQYHVLCKFRPYADATRPPVTYTLAATATCAADAQPGEQTVGVRVWVRDYATTETSIDHQVRLVR